MNINKIKKVVLLVCLLILVIFLVGSFVYLRQGFYLDKNLNTGTQTSINNKILSEIKNDEKVDDKVVTEENNNIAKNIPDNFYVEDVPFIVQAPKADWKDERQQDGCEEASVVMAVAWIQGEKSMSKSDALSRIITASDWFLNNIGTFHDASVTDVVRILEEKYLVKNVEIKDNPDVNFLKETLRQNKIILVPTNGQLLGNPNFSGRGPERHMIVLRGYSDETGEFITNDPGTRKGENYRYPYATILEANLSYPTGFHEKITENNKQVIVVGK